MKITRPKLHQLNSVFKFLNNSAHKHANSSLFNSKIIFWCFAKHHSQIWYMSFLNPQKREALRHNVPTRKVFPKHIFDLCAHMHVRHSVVFLHGPSCALGVFIARSFGWRWKEKQWSQGRERKEEKVSWKKKSEGERQEEMIKEMNSKNTLPGGFKPILQQHTESQETNWMSRIKHFNLYGSNFKNVAVQHQQRGAHGE